MSRINLSIKDAVSQIIASPAPLLLPDTSALLDLIRIPFRVKSSTMARQLLDAASYLAAQSQTSKPNLWVVIPPPVLHEWGENSRKTIYELQKHWSHLDTMIEIAHASANAVTVVLPSAVTYSHQHIESALENLSRDFFNNAIILNQEAICITRAYERVVNKQAPARKGSGIKDCVITEHSIELCSQLRSAGFTQKCVFITSNTKDFCTPGSTAPKDPLDSQLHSVNLSLTTNWQWARAELGI